MTKHVEDFKRAAEIIERKTIVGLCEGGFPITADECEFCGATWEDDCRRANQQETKP